MNKGRITPEVVLQEHKPVVLFASRQHQHLYPAQGSSRTSTHVFSFEKNHCKFFFNSLSHSRNVFVSVKTVIAQHTFM